MIKTFRHLFSLGLFVQSARLDAMQWTRDGDTKGRSNRTPDRCTAFWRRIDPMRSNVDLWTSGCANQAAEESKFLYGGRISSLHSW